MTVHRMVAHTYNTVHACTKYVSTVCKHVLMYTKYVLLRILQWSRLTVYRGGLTMCGSLAARSPCQLSQYRISVVHCSLQW